MPENRPPHGAGAQLGPVGDRLGWRESEGPLPAPGPRPGAEAGGLRPTAIVSGCVEGTGQGKTGCVGGQARTKPVVVHTRGVAHRCEPARWSRRRHGREVPKSLRRNVTREISPRHIARETAAHARSARFRARPACGKNAGGARLGRPPAGAPHQHGAGPTALAALAALGGGPGLARAPGLTRNAPAARLRCRRARWRAAPCRAGASAGGVPARGAPGDSEPGWGMRARGQPERRGGAAAPARVTGAAVVRPDSAGGRVLRGRAPPRRTETRAPVLHTLVKTQT